MISSQLTPIVAHLNKSSVLCKSLLGCTLCGFLLCVVSESLYKNVSIRVHEILPPNFHLWTVITYSFAERNVLCWLWSLFCVHLSATLLEPVWGAVELLRYLAIVQAALALFIPIVCYAIYVVARQHEEFLFRTCFGGLIAFDGAIFVAIKQFLPDSVLLATPMGRIKNCHLPFIAAVLAFVFGIVGMTNVTVPFMVSAGEYVGWLYLRFYQKHSNGTKGDMSEHFAWATFFPSAMQPLARAIADPLYGLLLRMKVCQPAIRHVDLNQLQSVAVMLPDAETQDAERRRQKALRELTERLNRSVMEDEHSGQSAWPSFDESAPSANRAAAPLVDFPLPHDTVTGGMIDPLDTAVQSEQKQADGADIGDSKPLLVLDDGAGR